MAVHERESTLGGVTFDRGSVGNHLTLEVGNDLTLKLGNDLTLKLGNDLTLKVGNDLAPELGNHLALEASKLGNYDGPRQDMKERIIKNISVPLHCYVSNHASGSTIQLYRRYVFNQIVIDFQCHYMSANRFVTPCCVEVAVTDRYVVALVRVTISIECI